MNRRKSFTLTEILIALTLTGLIILAVTSVDITSRRFFQAARRKARVQNEAKIAMEHITRNLQLGVGDLENPAFTIGNDGAWIEIRKDTNNNGGFDTQDIIVEYRYRGDPHYDIIYNNGEGNEEPITGQIISSCSFAVGDAPNRVEVTIASRINPDPEVGPSRENPETILTSSIVLRAMSIN